MDMIIGLALIGLLLGSQVNRGIYRLAWTPRSIGPWSEPLQEAADRRWSDYLPVVGWLGLRRESRLHGRGYWVRPAMIELVMGIGCVSIGCWLSADRVLPGDVAGASPWSTVVVPRILTWCSLLALLSVATFIDLDEQTIPDQVTISGTLLALVLAVIFPLSRLPVVVQGMVTPILVTTPSPTPDWLLGSRGLLYALAI